MESMQFGDYVINLRRELHMHPELSMEESWTSQRICQELTRLGIPYEIVGEKNVIGILHGSKSESTEAIALRADFDALPVTEEVNVPWKSKFERVMHACGHDAHTAILMGAAKLLVQDPDQFSGTVYLCFQQGEETGKGADACVAYLKSKGNVKYAFGAHVLSLLPPGVINLESGLRATGCYIFHIDIKGKGGHGARPDAAVSAAEIACDLYQHLIKIPSNHLEAARTCVVSPCMIHAGTKSNIIPETASIEGTIRFSGENDGELLTGMVEDLSKAVAKLYGGEAGVTFTTVAPYPIINDAKACEIGEKAAKDIGLRPVSMPPTSASDNFAEFQHEFPGFYCFIGSKPDREGSTGIHHAPTFDLDDSVLPKASEFFARLCALVS